MYAINTVDDAYFSLNGIKYQKYFIPVVYGNSIALKNYYDAGIEIANADYTQYTVNSSTFASVSLLQNALLSVVSSPFATATNFGGIKVGNGLKINSSTGKTDANIGSGLSLDSSNKIYANTPSSFKNKIINGNFLINQRGYTSGSIISSGSYCFDRWKLIAGTPLISFLPNTTIDNGNVVYITPGVILEQIVPAEYMPTGTYTLSWRNTNIGQISATVNGVPISNGGTFSRTYDGSNVSVRFTHSGTGPYSAIANVQLEMGTTATDFEYQEYQQQLSSCKRFYQKIFFTALSFTASWGGSAFCPASPIRFQDMYTTPSFFMDGYANGSRYWVNPGNYIVSGIGDLVFHLPVITKNSIWAYINRISGGLSPTMGYFYHYESDFNLNLSAEL